MLVVVDDQPAGTRSLHLRVVDTLTGAIRKDYVHLCPAQKRLDFAELFDNRLLIKHEGCDTVVVSVRQRCPEHEFVEMYRLMRVCEWQLDDTAHPKTVPRSIFPTPSAFLFLHNQGRFATIRGTKLTLWNADVSPADPFVSTSRGVLRRRAALVPNQRPCVLVPCCIVAGSKMEPCSRSVPRGDI